MKASQLLRIERLYRRRVPPDRIISPELARACTELSHELRCQIGLVLTRRGTVEQVIVGTAKEVDLSDLSSARRGPRSLRGVRLVHTHLRNEPLTPDDLTDLALLRLDLIAAIGVGPEGLPADLYLAHLLPPNPRAQAYEIWPPTPFHSVQVDCGAFVESLERELARGQAALLVRGEQESALLLSVSTRSRVHQEERLEELTGLAQSNGIVVLGTVVQRTQEIHPKYLLGSGKLKEVVIKALQQGVDLLIFDQDLTPAQVRAIAEVTEIKVIDRTQLILDIFARRAHSREGKIQVELAQLRYLLPRLSGHSPALSRLGGGIGGRGPGETKLEMDRRRVRDRIHHLERQLAAFVRQRDQRRARRMRHGAPIVSIVGYTNAGKSTLLNALTESDVPAQDRPFETLDTSSRRLRLFQEFSRKRRATRTPLGRDLAATEAPPGHEKRGVQREKSWSWLARGEVGEIVPEDRAGVTAGEAGKGGVSAPPGRAGEAGKGGVSAPPGRAGEIDIIVTDTVGFIRDLPKDLMGAFRATLEELRDADLLLHLADASSSDLDGQIRAVESTLSDLELDQIPRLLVFNKCDRLLAEEVEALTRRYRAMAVSALRRETLLPLVEVLTRSLAEDGSQQKVRDNGGTSAACTVQSHQAS